MVSLRNVMILSFFSVFVSGRNNLGGRLERFVIFGDDFSYYGVDVRNDIHGFQRSSNGPIWSEYLAEKIQIPPNGTENFAYSGAKSGWGNYFFPNWSGVLWQIYQFVKSYDSVPSRSLVALQSGGANDLFEGADESASVLENNIQALRRLAQNGAKTILFLNIGDVTFMPGFKEEQFASNEAVVKDRISETNRRLFSAINFEFSREFPSVQIIFFDYQKAWWSLLTDKFDDLTSPFSRKLPSLAEKSQWRHVWFDKYHMTTSAHKLLADSIADILELHLVA